MIISCPQCYAKYSIKEIKIPPTGKKMHCSNCNKMWRAYPQDNSHNSHLPEKTYTHSFTGSLLTILLFLLVIFICANAYIFRSNIVSNFAFTKHIFEFFCISV